MPKIKPLFRVILYFLTAVCGILAVACVVSSKIPAAIDIVFYTVSAVGLLVSGYYCFSTDLPILCRNLRALINSNPFSARLYGDYTYRSVAFSSVGTIITILYALLNGLICISSGSCWYGLLALYYFLLAFIRVHLLRKCRKESILPVGEIKKSCCLCGILLALLSALLGGSVFFMVFKGNAKNYPGFLIYATAFYTFCKVTMSVLHMVRTRRINHMLLSALRTVQHADALVSLLALQTAMLMRFGADDSRMISAMNLATGTVVCAALLINGLSLTVRATKRRNIEF